LKITPKEPLWLATLLPVGLGLLFIYFIMPFEKVGQPSPVARGIVACGEVLLTQTFTGTSDPYYVLFYFRANGANEWAEFYVDDQSPYWRGNLEISPRGDSCSVTFYTKAVLSYGCGDRSLGRKDKISTFARAIVADALSRDYRDFFVKLKTPRSQVDAYWAKR